MSVRVSSVVWEHSEQRGAAFVLLLALADAARDDGVCWPGTRHLVRKTRSARSTTIDNLHRLVESGELVLLKQGVGRRPNLYRVNVDHLRTLPSVQPDFTDDVAEWGLRWDGSGFRTSGERAQESGERTAAEEATDRSAASSGPATEPDPLGPVSEVERKEHYVLPKKTPEERVWAYYVQVFEKPLRPLPADERKIIAEALKAVAGREEDLTLAIDGNKASAFHQGENPGRKKYNSLSQILKGKRAGQHGSGRTTLETIEMFMERAAEATRPGSSASDADISRAKRAVLDALTYPGDEHVAKRGEEAVEWLASEVGTRWNVERRAWEPIR